MALNKLTELLYERCKDPEFASLYHEATERAEGENYVTYLEDLVVEAHTEATKFSLKSCKCVLCVISRMRGM